MILNWGTTAPVPFFLSWLAEDCLPAVDLRTQENYYFGSCIFKKMVALFLFEWLFSWV